MYYSDEIVEEFYSVSDEQPEELLVGASEAFSDKEDIKKRFEGKKLSELLTI